MGIQSLIENNPFRLLGLFSSSSSKEMLANLNKLKAYLKVNKSISFPSDLTFFFKDAHRTIEKITQAEAELALPRDRLKHALFWFIDHDPQDHLAISALQSGDVAKAEKILKSKKTFSSMINQGVLFFSQGNIKEGIEKIVSVIHSENLRKAFVETVCGEKFEISEIELSEKLFLDTLRTVMPLEEFGSFVSGSDTEYILSSFTDTINQAIAKAENASDDPDDQLAAGNELAASIREPLLQLKNVLGSNDIAYQTVADKVAEQILQCSINYFNKTEDRDSYFKTYPLAIEAKNIAVGDLVRERINKNINELKKIQEETEYYKIIEEIDNILKKTVHSSASKDSIENLIFYAFPLVRSLGDKAGINSEIYKQWSGNVCTVTINTIGKKIADDLTAKCRPYIVLDFIEYSKTVIDKLKNLNLDLTHKKEVDELDGVLSTLSIRMKFAENQTIDSLDNASFDFTTHTPKKTSEGCYIATMVYGSYDHPQVIILRDFRDRVLMKYSLGRKFVKLYYTYSQKLVKHLNNRKKINLLIRSLLDIFIKVYRYAKK